MIVTNSVTDFVRKPENFSCGYRLLTNEDLKTSQWGQALL